MLKILLFDIETRPLLSYTWGLWDQNVIRVKEEFEILSVAWKWLGETKINFLSKEGKKSDKVVVKKIHALLNESDVVIGHNCKQFDVKKAQARFIVHGLLPTSPFLIIDTKCEAKKYFKFDSNSLDNLGQYLGVGRKEKTGGFDLWLQCMADDPKAWKQMEKYNKQDVALLEKVYLKLRPWIKTQNVDNFTSCPKCGSTELQSRGRSRSLAGYYRKFQCKQCGGWCRSVILDEKKPKNSMRNI